jgi:putative transposase
MPRNVYSEINLHITWHTKQSLPMIKAQLESRLFQYFKDRIIETPETYFHAVGGTENHIHLAVSISPKLEIAKWIGQLKGASSHHINKSASRKLLEWQDGYGVVSFGTKDLPWIIKYIQNQKEHHRTQKTFERLEKIEC